MSVKKAMWRCVSDIWGYCSGEPDWETPPEHLEGERGLLYPHFGGICKRDPKTCKRHQTQAQSLKARARKGVAIAK